MIIWDLEDGDECCDSPIAVTDLDTGQSIEIAAVAIGRIIKAGTLTPDDFSGSPLLAAVVFTTDFANATYVITLTGEDARLFTYQSKSASGFTVNANSDEALTGEVSWMATASGETI